MTTRGAVMEATTTEGVDVLAVRDWIYELTKDHWSKEKRGTGTAYRPNGNFDAKLRQSLTIRSDSPTSSRTFQVPAGAQLTVYKQLKRNAKGWSSPSEVTLATVFVYGTAGVLDRRLTIRMNGRIDEKRH